MLYGNMLQFNTCMCCLLVGIIMGIIVDIKKLLQKPIIKSKWLVAIADCIFVVLYAFFYLLSINLVSFGQIRLYSFIIFVIGTFLEQISISSLVALFLKAIYNFFKSKIIAVKEKKKSEQSKFVLPRKTD